MAHDRGAQAAVKVVSFLGRLREPLGPLLDPGIELVVVDWDDAEAISRHLPDARILLSTRFDAALTKLCTSLALVLSPAAGTEGIDRAALPAGVAVIGGIGHEIPMSEYVIAAIVSLRQRIAASDDALRAGRWEFGFFGAGGYVDEVYGSTLGIVGFGRIGREVARRGRAFGMKTRAVTMHPSSTAESELLESIPGSLGSAADVDELIASSDAIVVACELSDVSRGLFDERRFAKMRQNAILVNVARGPIVDERALYDALARKRIAGAAIDVWYAYPEDGSDQTHPSALPFHSLANVIMTPHSSGWTRAAQARKMAFLADRINEFARAGR